MIYNIKAIPTKYAGVNFRSRLEARWAAFFDLAGFIWDYEPIDLNGWAPDFSLHIAGCSVLAEVKPVDLNLIVNDALQQRATIIPLTEYEKAIKHKDNHCVLLLGVAPINTSTLKSLGIVLGKKEDRKIDDVMQSLISVERTCKTTGEVVTAHSLWREAGSIAQWKADTCCQPDINRAINVTALMEKRKKRMKIGKVSV